MRSDWVLMIAVLGGLVLVVAVLARLVVLLLLDRRPSPWAASTGLLAGRATRCSPAGPPEPGGTPASGRGTADAGTRDAGPDDAELDAELRDTELDDAEVRCAASDVVEKQPSLSSGTAPERDDGLVLDTMADRLDAVFEAADLRWPD